MAGEVIKNFSPEHLERLRKRLPASDKYDPNEPVAHFRLPRNLIKTIDHLSIELEVEGGEVRGAGRRRTIRALLEEGLDMLRAEGKLPKDFLRRYPDPPEPTS